MLIKEENEITVNIKCDIDEAIKLFKAIGYYKFFRAKIRNRIR